MVGGLLAPTNSVIANKMINSRQSHLMPKGPKSRVHCYNPSSNGYYAPTNNMFPSGSEEENDGTCFLVVGFLCSVGSLERAQTSKGHHMNPMVIYEF